jgi:hypothetical protein
MVWRHGVVELVSGQSPTPGANPIYPKSPIRPPAQDRVRPSNAFARVGEFNRVDFAPKGYACITSDRSPLSTHCPLLFADQRAHIWAMQAHEPFRLCDSGF